MLLNIQGKVGYLLNLFNWNLGRTFLMNGGGFRVAAGTEGGAGRRLCIFAHYSEDSRVDRYVVSYLKAIAEAEAEIVFVSSSPGLSESEKAKISGLCRLIILRENKGYDFGSWKVGIGQCGDLEKYEQVILANDSVYGPLFPLEEAFGKMDGGADFWGITDCWMPRHHLQSYFMVFNRSVFTSSAFRSFWETLPFFRRKKDIINNCEVRLTKHLASHGFRCGALIPYGSIEVPRSRSAWGMRLEGLARTGRLNPTHFFWDVMIEKYRCPFLKVELLRKNPVKIQNLHLLPETIGSLTEYDFSLVEEHLAGRGRNKIR